MHAHGPTNLGHILLHNAVFPGLDLLWVLEDKYSFALRATLWLSDKGLVLLGTTVSLKITIARERERSLP